MSVDVVTQTPVLVYKVLQNMFRMNLPAELYWFLKVVREDNRIGPIHISLYVAILQHWIVNERQNSIHIVPNDLMHQSKISGRNTYYKSIKELHKYGYILYKPSHNGLKGSFITVCQRASDLK